MRKLILSLVAIAVLLAACGDSASPAFNPNDLGSLKKEVKEKENKIRELKAEIAELEEKIEVLDTTKRVKPRRLVTTMPVEKEAFNRFVEIQSTIEADDLVMVTSEVAGRITQMTMKEGDGVRRGQLIASLDMESVDKQIAELETALSLARDVYTRQKRLWDQNIGSEIQYLEAKNGVERLEKSLETVQFQLTKSKVYAPISGVVDRVTAKSGELAMPGVPIIQILNTNKVKVVAAVPERYLTAVKRGDQVRIEFPALDMEKVAKVTQIGRTIHPANRTFEVEVDLPNGKGIFKPNLLALMHINDYSEKEAISVPADAIQQEIGGKDYVYVVAEGEEGPFAKKIYITKGESADNRIVITEGLKGGEQLNLEGARTLAENELVQIQEGDSQSFNDLSVK